MRIWPDCKLSRKGFRLGMQMVRMLRHCTTAMMMDHSHMSKVGSAVVRDLSE